MRRFTGLFVVFSMAYAEIVRLAVFVLSHGISDGGAKDTVPPGNEPFSKKETPA
jgi:hypothetical protein